MAVNGYSSITQVDVLPTYQESQRDSREITRLQMEEFDTIYQQVKACVKTDICLALFIISAVSVTMVLATILRDKLDE